MRFYLTKVVIFSVYLKPLVTIININGQKEFSKDIGCGDSTR